MSSFHIRALRPLLILSIVAMAALLAAVLLPEHGTAAGPAQGSPATPVPTGTPGPAPSPTRSANALEGTVAAISGTDITINTSSGQLQTISVPATVEILRNGQPSSLDAIEATDNIVIQRDSSGKVLGLIVFSAPAVPTAAPTVTVTPSAAPTSSELAVTGVVSSVSGTVLTIAADDGTTQTVDANAPGVKITRDNADAQAADIKAGDRVFVVLGPDKKARQIAATSNAAPPVRQGPDPKWLLYAAVMLVPFLLLALPWLLESKPSFMARRREG